MFKSKKAKQAEADALDAERKARRKRSERKQREYKAAEARLLEKYADIAELDARVIRAATALGESYAILDARKELGYPLHFSVDDTELIAYLLARLLQHLQGSRVR